LFRPGCPAATNVNGDLEIDIADPISLLGHLFLGGDSPAAPFPACGRGPLELDAELGCLEPSRGCP
jgi:hypothetical protein